MKSQAQGHQKENSDGKKTKKKKTSRPESPGYRSVFGFNYIVKMETLILIILEVPFSSNLFLVIRVESSKLLSHQG